MDQQTTDPGVMFGVFLAIGTVCSVVILLRCYVRWCKSNPRKFPLAEWQTFSLPGPEEPQAEKPPQPQAMNFEAFYMGLIQEEKFTREEAQGLHRVYIKTAKGGGVRQEEQGT